MFPTRPDRPWSPPSLLRSGYRFSFLGVKQPGRDVDYPSHLAPRFEKEWNYTFTPPPPEFHGLF